MPAASLVAAEQAHSQWLYRLERQHATCNTTEHELHDESCSAAGATSILQEEGLAFPESAQAGQLIKLPGQTRVTPEEYSEFTALGQGGVYELDLDRCRAFTRLNFCPARSRSANKVGPQAAS